MDVDPAAGIQNCPRPSPAAAAAAADTIEDLHPDVLTRTLRRLDGPALAAASCATSHLRSLSSQPELWRDLCLSTWPSLRHPRLLQLIPSFPNSYRSFFSDAYPFPSPRRGPATDDDDAQLPSKLVSAVDLYHKGVPFLSRVVETDTSTPWFRGSPFRVDGLDRNDPPQAEPPVVSPEELTLSWVVIDPDGRRAVNVSSRRAVEVDRHWYTGETLVRFATVLGEGCAVGAVVTCGEETGHVREVSLTVEDMEGMWLTGRDSLVILKDAMMGWGRRGSGEAWEEEAKVRYAEHVRRRRWMKERKVRREGILDLCCSAVGVAVFLAFVVLVAFK